MPRIRTGIVAHQKIHPLFCPLQRASSISSSSVLIPKKPYPSPEHLWRSAGCRPTMTRVLKIGCEAARRHAFAGLLCTANLELSLMVVSSTELLQEQRLLPKVALATKDGAVNSIFGVLPVTSIRCLHVPRPGSRGGDMDNQHAENKRGKWRSGPIRESYRQVLSHEASILFAASTLSRIQHTTGGCRLAEPRRL